MVVSPDKRLSALFEPETLTHDSMVMIVPVEIEKIGSVQSVSSNIRPSVLADIKPEVLRNLQMSNLSGEAANELEPVGLAYMMHIPAGRIKGRVSMNLVHPQTDNRKGLALFTLDEKGEWQFVPSALNGENFSFSTGNAGMFAVMRDTAPPKASMITAVDMQQPFRIAQPSFEWHLKDAGTRVNPDTVRIMLEGEEQFPSSYDPTSGRLTFTPLRPLLGGNYEIAVKASDNAGNESISQGIRFAVKPPLRIHEVTQFPNPANSRVSIRVATNRDDITTKNLEIVIYDVAGEKVADGREMVIRSTSDGTRRIQDITWNLRNNRGRVVANGVYIARITLRDPDDWSKTTRYNHKIAVLR